MPLYKIIKPNIRTRILVWKIEEELSFLEDIYLNKKSKDRVSNMKSVIHQKGFLSVRFLLAELGYTDDDLFYTNNGKPHLKDGKRISISHSFNFSTIIVSKYSCGIDIEKNRTKIIKIANKFIGNEMDFIEPHYSFHLNKNAPDFLRQPEDEINLIRKLTVVWGAKESLFKIHPKGGLLFKHHLPIEKFRSNSKKTRGWIIKDNYYEVYDIHFEYIENFTLVYAIS